MGLGCQLLLSQGRGSGRASTVWVPAPVGRRAADNLGAGSGAVWAPAWRWDSDDAAALTPPAFLLRSSR